MDTGPGLNASASVGCWGLESLGCAGRAKEAGADGVCRECVVYVAECRGIKFETGCGQNTSVSGGFLFYERHD